MTEIRVIGMRTARTLPQLIPEIASARRDGRQVFVLVPEQYTLQAELELIEGLHTKGLLDIDVVSPRRLSQLVHERAGSPGLPVLSSAGSTMAVAQALQNVRGDLTCYAGSVNRPGLPERMASLIAELDESGADPDWLESLAEGEDGAEERSARASALSREKEKDIARVWRAYRELIAGRFIDAAGEERSVTERLPASGLVDGADVFVCGFDVLHPRFVDQLAVMAGRARSLTVAMTLCAPGDPDRYAFRCQRFTVMEMGLRLERLGITMREEQREAVRDEAAPELRWMERNLFTPLGGVWNGPCGALHSHTAATPDDEALFAADQLRRWHSEGIPWSRMSVALAETDTLPAVLAGVLTAAGIPHYLARKDPASRHGLCRMLTAACAAASTGFDQRPVLDWLDSGFTPLETDEALRLRCYAVRNGIRWKKWMNPFTRGDDAAATEELRLRAIPPLIEFRRRLDAAEDGAQAAEALWQLMTDTDAYGRLLRRERELLDRGLTLEAGQNRQVWRAVLGLLDQIHVLLAGQRTGLKEITRLVTAGLESIRISGLPPAPDSVTVGEAGHMLAGRTEALLLMGMQDGVTSSRRASLLTDSERASLRTRGGLPIGLSDELTNSLRRSDFYRTMTLPTRFLTVTHAAGTADGGVLMPVTLLGEMRRIFPSMRVTGGATAEGSSLPLSPRLALEQLPVLIRRCSERGEALPPLWQEALRRLLGDECWAEKTRAMLEELNARILAEPLPADLAGTLYTPDEVSITRLETFASCAYRHFVRYGLGPEEERGFELGADERGNFFHAVLCRYAELSAEEPAWPDIPDERIDALVEAAARPQREAWKDGPLEDDAVGAALGEELMRTVRRAARMFTRHAQHSGFTATSAEVRFGDGGLPPVVLELSDGRRIALRGIIDRIDRWQGDDGLYLRVVDYKSGEQSLDAVRMHWGLQLQLILYLEAATRGEHGFPAGAYYFRVQDPLVETEHDLVSEAEAALAKQLRLSGVTLADAKVIAAMNGDGGDEVIGSVLTQKGVPKKNVLAADLAGMTALMRYAHTVAGRLAEHLLDGEIGIHPARIGEWTACTFCPYAAVCGRDDRLPGGQPRDPEVEKDEAWLRMTASGTESDTEQ
ncbi:MAG: PD-(D/E)XK nuclease family protein [Clostridia bacterium]|nr:PD-(D/E)XK nuclease family protein [Clostridia bacterium]